MRAVLHIKHDFKYRHWLRIRVDVPVARAPTDRSFTGSLTTIGCWAPRAMRPNNTMLRKFCKSWNIRLNIILIIIHHLTTALVVTVIADEQRAMSASCVIRIMTSARESPLHWLGTGSTKHRKGPQRTAQDPRKDRKGPYRTTIICLLGRVTLVALSLIHISEPTRPY